MDSLSPTEGQTSDPLVRGFVSWWNTKPPQDESTRPQWARKSIEHQTRIVLPVCLFILAGGAFLRPLGWWQVAIMTFCGILDTRLLLGGLRGYGQKNAFLSSGPCKIPGAIFAVTSLEAEHALHYFGTIIYAAVCAQGVHAFLCWLFREPFLRYVETPA